MRIVITGVLLVAVSITPTLAGHGRESLRGLPGVEAIAEKIPEDVERSTGLTHGALRTALELRLRQHGIRVLSMDSLTDLSALRTTGGATLYLTTNILVNRSSCAWTADLIVMQSIMLKRDPTAVVNTVATREARGGGTIGVVPCDEVRKVILEYVPELVDEFANDYLAVNPKE